MSDLTVNALVRDFGSSSWSSSIPVTFTQNKMVKFSGKEFKMLRKLDSGAYAGSQGDKGKLQFWCRNKFSYLVNTNVKQNRIDIIVAPEPRMDDADDLYTKGMSIGFSFSTLDDYQKVMDFLFDLKIPESQGNQFDTDYECNNRTAGLTKEKLKAMKPSFGGVKKRKSHKKRKSLKKRKTKRKTLKKKKTRRRRKN